MHTNLRWPSSDSPIRLAPAGGWAVLWAALAVFLIWGACGFVGPAQAQSSTALAEQRRTLFEQLQALEPTGHAEVLYHLGMFHNNGLGTPADPKTAFRLYLQASPSGLEAAPAPVEGQPRLRWAQALAAYKVGCYYAGQFKGAVEPNEEQAVRYKAWAAEAGYDLAQYDLGVHHARLGQWDAALQWWERASRQGHVLSTAVLAKAWTEPATEQPVRAWVVLSLLRDRRQGLPPELEARWQALDVRLGGAEREQAQDLRGRWVGPPSALSRYAREGTTQVNALVNSLQPTKGTSP